MKPRLNPSTRTIVANTLPLVELCQEQIEDAMTRWMTRYGPRDPAGEGPRTVVWAIMNMMIAHAYAISGRGEPSCLADMGENHRAMGIGGEHYSMFGDGLSAVLKDVLAADAAPSVVSAWIDAYWAIVRATYRQDLALAA